MKINLAAEEINSLFANSDPDKVWAKAACIVNRINPSYDFTLVRSVFDDVMRLFRGEYPGYSPIRTLYHDLPHTLDVFLCAVRLLHGIHISGEQQDDDSISLVMIATLMHDLGYAQRESEATGTGAQFTQIHVRRGISFMRSYLAQRRFPSHWADKLEVIMLSTDPAVKFFSIVFHDDATRKLSQIVGTADLTGQMADRTYLEKLLFLYLEFKEAHFGNYQSIYDMLRQTKTFYETTMLKLDVAYESIYDYLAAHFTETMGADRNFYIESIDKNIAYLDRVIALNEAEYLSMLKRGGIVERSRSIAVPD